MRVCIPTEDNRGLDSRLYDHFGSAPYLALVDTETENVEVVPNTGHRHGADRCSPIDHIDVERTDAVVCQGMGKRALASMSKGGMDVLITSADTIRSAVAEVRQGKLRKLSVDRACGGRGERHRCRK